MEVLEEKPNRSTRTWIRSAENEHSARVDYYGELRSWVQHAILEAEKNRNSEKKDQLLSLLKEL